MSRLIASASMTSDLARGERHDTLRVVEKVPTIKHSDGLPRLVAREFFDAPYPSFGRMDALCQLGVCVTRLIESIAGFDDIDRNEVFQIGHSRFACFDIDKEFDSTRLAGAPSPAKFLYTLPSMFQGEIAIRFGLMGACTMLVGIGDQAVIDTIIERKSKHAPVLFIDVEGHRVGDPPTFRATARLYTPS